MILLLYCPCLPSFFYFLAESLLSSQNFPSKSSDMIMLSFYLKICRYVKQSLALTCFHILHYCPIHITFKHKESSTSTGLHILLCPLPLHIPSIFFYLWSPDKLFILQKSAQKSPPLWRLLRVGRIVWWDHQGWQELYQSRPWGLN